MGEEGVKLGLTSAEVAALIAAEATARDTAIAAEATARNTAIATHAALFGLHTKVVPKTADQSVTNSITLVSDTELLFAIAANEVWMLFLLLKVATTAVADFKFTFTMPTNGTLSFQETFRGSGTLAPYYAAAAAMVMATGSNVTNAVVFAMGIAVNSATAGYLQFQWAQNTAEATDTQVLTNSCLIAHKLA